jgi:hypothetical protein
MLNSSVGGVAPMTGGGMSTRRKGLNRIEWNWYRDSF